jgi:hypothetical protein
MAVGIAAATLNAWLDALCRSVAYSDPAAFYVKLHIGDPGAAGANNAAGETTRKQATFSAAGSGAITTSADLTWTNVSTAETYSHVSYWDASSAGTFLGSAALAASKTVAVGDTFTILAGDIDLAITPVAA